MLVTVSGQASQLLVTFPGQGLQLPITFLGQRPFFEASPPRPQTLVPHYRVPPRLQTLVLHYGVPPRLSLPGTALESSFEVASAGATLQSREQKNTQCPRTLSALSLNSLVQKCLASLSTNFNPLKLTSMGLNSNMKTPIHIRISSATTLIQSSLTNSVNPSH